jgi:hypothetical protein
MKTTLNTNQLKSIALKQFLNEDFFIINGKAYDGTMQSAEEAHYEWEHETSQFDSSFEEFCAEQLTQIEEYNEYKNDYLVLTDEEADERWEESLDNYLQECIYPELTGNLQNYFDDEKWKRDARYDGRGHSLSGYDGNENEETVQGITFYIYRQN